MDDKSFNIHNNLLGYSKSPFFSTTSTSKENLPNEDKTKKSHRQINCSIDIDQSDTEENSFKNISMNNIENSKLEYRRKLIANLNNTKNMIYENKPNSKDKTESNTQLVSIKRSIQSVESETNSSYIPKSKINYRTICNDTDSKPPRNSISSNNKLDNSGFLSLSRQSLNDSLNESGITNTASRITANILKHNLTKKTETSPKTIPNMGIVTKYPSRTLRYRTITKKDNFSSYLTRVVNDGDLFGSPSTTPVSLSLNLTENTSSKRVDFSKIIKTPESKRLKANITSANQTWNCTNCEGSNPQSFNFCPICSAPNPKLTLSGKLNLKRFHNDRSKCGWTCQRCSTKNEDDRNSCIFCFKNKTDLPETETPFIKKRKILDNSVETEPELEVFKFTENEKNTKFAFEDNSSIFKFGSNNDFSSKDKVDVNIEINKEKWNCPTCMVDNSVEMQSCPCCLTKNPNNIPGKVNSGKTFAFGNNTAENTSIKFGSNIDSNQTGPLNSSVNVSTIKIGSNIDSNQTGPLSSSLNVSTIKFGANSDSKSNEKWNCPTCMVDNASEKETCPCCMTKNPNMNSLKNNKDKPLLFQFGNSSVESSSIKFGSNNESSSETVTSNGLHSDKKWNCPTCLVDNKADSDKCPCCSTKNPNLPNHKTLFKLGSDSSQSSIIFGSASSLSSKVEINNEISKENWNCPTCLVDNTADKESCPCCLTKNPNIKSVKPNNEKPLLKFGNSSGSATTFKFGSNNDSESKIDSEKPLFKFDNNSNSVTTFKFGLNNDFSSSNDKDKSLFKFGNDSTSKSTFKFGLNNDFPSSIDSDKSLFKFGNNSSLQATSLFGLNSDSLQKISSSSGPVSSTGEKWNCALCLVDNAAGARSCVCCQTARPIKTINPNELTTNSVGNVSGKVSAVNGVDQVATITSNSVNKSVFQFGIPNADSTVVKNTDSGDSTELVFQFSPATSLGMTSTLQVPVDLEFEFAAPLLL